MIFCRVKTFSTAVLVWMVAGSVAVCAFALDEAPKSESKKHAHGHYEVEKQEPSPPPPKGFDNPDYEIVIETLRGRMKYDLETFRVAPGSKVKLTLVNRDDMPHNIVVCRPLGPDVGMEVARKAWDLGGAGMAKHYLPEHPAVLFPTTLVAPRASSDFYFEAPENVGRYPYVCTLPGHVFYMKGVMLVEKAPTTPDGKLIGLSEVAYKVFEGDWSKLPDFSKLEPVETGVLKRGRLLTHRVAGERNRYALLYEGNLTVPYSSRYSFELGSSDGSRLEVNGQQVINHDGVHNHSPKTGGINLKPGEHAFRLSYFRKENSPSLALRWRGAGVPTAWLTQAAGKGGAGSIPILPTVQGEAVIYRNFIAGAGTRAIAVGYPESVNLAFDANAMRLALLWQGAFMDGARHWSGRGQGFQGPAGYALLKLPESRAFAFLESKEAAWPKLADHGRATEQRFLGYQRDKKRRPAFLYQIGEVKVRDFPSGGQDVLPYLVRSYELEGDSSGRKLFYLAAAGNDVRKEGDAYVVDGKYAVDFPELAGITPVLRSSGGRRELLLPLAFESKLAFNQRYRWRFE